MTRRILFSFAAILTLSATAEPFGAVKSIVGRLAGGYDGSSEQGLDRAKASEAMSKFEFALLEGGGERATIGPDSTGGKILIRATSASAASFALGRYVRDVQKGCVSWCGNRIPNDWPVPSETVSVAPAVPVRFAYNYCTLSYTMAFWSASEWREEIDRLALSGFNAALVVQGLPAVWRATLSSVVDAEGRRLFTDDDIRAFIADEAAEAWWHMGNLEGLGGPLSDERIEADAALGRWIYAEMMRLGIQPSIQSFVGLVPDVANAVLANGVDADGKTFGSDPRFFILDQGRWQGYVRPDVVNPLSTAFDFLAEKWYAALKEVYRPDENGWTTFMGGDLFHEGGQIGSLTDADLAAAARKIQASQARHFGNGGKNAVTWVLQSWQGTPRQGIRNGLDPKRTLIQFLDKDMSKTGAVKADYVNKATGGRLPWIWAEVLNFGGNTGLHGGLRRFRSLAKVGEGDPAFRGYGMLSEGLETNAAMYDLFTDAFSFDIGTTLDDAALEAWWGAHSLRRYGVSDGRLVRALAILGRTAWDCPHYQEGCVENILCAVPDLNVKNVSKWGPRSGTEYDPSALFPAARALLDAARARPELLGTETFRFDFCELFLQLIGDRARILNSRIGAPGAARTEFLSLFDLAEGLLCAEPRWTLGWHESRTIRTAGKAGASGYRRMVTSWTGDWASGRSSGLRDYAHRAYAGLLKNYYARRWKWFFELKDGKMAQGEYEAKLRELDAAFLTAELSPTRPGDLVAIACEIIDAMKK